MLNFTPLPDLKALENIELFQKLGQICQDNIPENWQSATIKIEIIYEKTDKKSKNSEEKANIKGKYKTLDPTLGSEKEFKTGLQVYAIFREIRKRTQVEGKENWQTAVFSIIQETGKFDIQFNYKDEAVSEPTN